MPFHSLNFLILFSPFFPFSSLCFEFYNFGDFWHAHNVKLEVKSDECFLLLSHIITCILFLMSPFRRNWRPSTWYCLSILLFFISPLYDFIMLSFHLFFMVRESHTYIFMWMGGKRRIRKHTSKGDTAGDRLIFVYHHLSTKKME